MKTIIRAGFACLILIVVTFSSPAVEPSTARKIKGALVFTTPIIHLGTNDPPEAESIILGATLTKLNTEGIKVGFEGIEEFIRDYPNSAWSPCLRSQLAERYRVMGRYSAALEHWERSWSLTKDSDDPAGKKITARSLMGWLELLGSLGRKEQMEVLMNEAEQRGLFDSPFAPALRSSREALAVMNERPKDAFRCGSVALGNLMKSIDSEKLPWREVRNTPSPDGGFKMSELVDLARSNHFNVVSLHRKANTEIPVPSVVHWKLDHYAAIISQKGDRYQVVDPTFGTERWLDANTINEEASGYYITPETNAPPTWNRLTKAEAAMVRGRGFTQGVDDNEDNNGDDDDDDDCPPPDANDGPEGSGDPCPSDAGMPVWSVSEPYMTLWISDVPLYYRNARGNWEKLRLSYKQRALPRDDTVPVGGFGDGWECNWIGFLEKDSASPALVKNHLAGGGIIGFPTDGTREYQSGRLLSLASGDPSRIASSGSGGGGGSSVSASSSVSSSSGGTAISRHILPAALSRSSGGRDNLYGFPTTLGVGVTRFFRTNQMDRYSRKVDYNFEKVTVSSSDYIRLTNRVDKDGKACTIAYTNTNFPRLITSVTDPYERSAFFEYDHLGRLTNITDMAGLSSSFRYHSDSSITNMVTPYGTNSFRFFNRAGGPAVWSRSLEVTEPTGTKQLFTYHDGYASGVGHHMYTYHWNRARYAALSSGGKADPMDGMSSGDFDIAPRKEWMRSTNIAEIARLIGTIYQQWDSFDPQVHDRTSYIRYNYPEQGSVGYNVIGPIKRPDAIYFESTGDKMEIPRNVWGRPTEIRYFRTVNGTPTVASFTNIFNADGRRLEKVWGPNGEQVRGYGYTNTTLTNLLTSVTNATGDVIRYTYDAGVRVTSITQPSGLVTTNIYYDSGVYAGFLKTRIDVGIRTNHYTWLHGNLEWHTNELGLVTKRTWDKLNRTTSVLFFDAAGTTTVSNIFDKLDLVSVKDRLNHWTHSGYNRLQQMVAQTNANGQVTEWDHCGCGAPSQITVWNGSTPLITQYFYNMSGSLTNVVYPDGYSLNYLNDLGGRLAQVSDQTGLQMDLTYAEYDQLKNVGLNSSGYYLSERTFDQYGRLATIKDRNGITITNAYDVLGRLTNRATLDIYGYVSNTVSYAYTARGLTNSTDELGANTRFVYDEAGRLLSQTNGNDEVLQFTYNAADQMLTLVDGKGQPTTWNYDEYGRVTNKLDATSTPIFRYKYDQDNRLTNRWTLAKGDTFYTYDAIGNLTNVDYPGAIMDIVMKYDGLNRLTNVLDAVGITKFAYNDAGQLLSEDGPWADDAVSYSYDARRRATMTINSQPTTYNFSYGYDQFNRLANVVSAAGNFIYDYGSGVSDRVLNLGLSGQSSYSDRSYIANAYDPLARLLSTTLYGVGSVPRNQHIYEMNESNQRTKQTFTGGNFIDYTYDEIGQLKTAKGKEAGGATTRLNEQFGYDYDKAWNLNYRTNNALTQTFNVDTKNQLTTATRSGTLTVAGQANLPGADLTSVTVSGTGLTTGSAAVYEDGSWAKSGATPASSGNSTYTAIALDTSSRTASDTINLSLPSTITFQYDGNGNLTNDGRRVFEYDYENQLTNVYLASAWKSEFRYDAFGRKRIQRDYGWQASAWTLTNEVKYVYDGMLVIQERHADNPLSTIPYQPVITYTRGTDLSGSLQGAGGIGGLLARTENVKLLTLGSALNAHAYYHADGNGNITAMVNTNGIVVARYNYDPYGNLLGMSGPLAEANNYRFSSKEWNGNAGLYYYGFRFYEPNVQRWLNRDPLGEVGFEARRRKEANLIGDVPNLYNFVHNKPLNATDSLGLKLTIDDCNKFLAQALRGIKEQLAQDARTGAIKGALYLIAGTAAAATGGVGVAIGVGIGGTGTVMELFGAADTISDIRERSKAVQRLYDRCKDQVTKDLEKASN